VTVEGARKTSALSADAHPAPAAAR